MIQYRNGNFLNSLRMTFQKINKLDGSETPEPSMLESRLRLERRIELALGSITEPASDRA